MQMNKIFKFLCVHLATCLLVLPPIFTALTYSSEYINIKEHVCNSDIVYIFSPVKLFCFFFLFSSDDYIFFFFFSNSAFLLKCKVYFHTSDCQRKRKERIAHQAFKSRHYAITMTGINKD